MLVFDLDETLVHCIFNDKDIDDAHVFLDIKMPNGKFANTGFNIRPYVNELMEAVKEDWEIVVFTASCQNYADTILDHLDPENKYFNHRFYRPTCWRTPEGVYVKDLRVFHQWALEDIVLVDNAVYSFGHQLDNGIPIFNYIQGEEDKQLLYLKEFLLSIKNKDVIKELKRAFKMTELYEADVDSFLDIYDKDVESEDELQNDEILDHMIMTGSFSRMKSASVSDQMVSRPQFVSDAGLTTNDNTNDDFRDIDATRSVSGQFTPSEMTSNPFFEAAMQYEETSSAAGTNLSQKDIHKSEQAKKNKKKRRGYGTIKKTSSQVMSMDVPQPRTSLLDKPKGLLMPCADEGGSLDTPKRAKRHKKRKKASKMKEVKLGVYSKDDSDLIEEEPHEMERLSLFAQKNAEEMKGTESPASESSDEELQVDQNRLRTQSYTFINHSYLHSSSIIGNKKRKSSPSLNESTGKDSDNSLSKSHKNKKFSRTSSESDDLDRDDEELGDQTTSASKHHNSNYSSENARHSYIDSTGHRVSNFSTKFDDIKEEIEESSPRQQRDKDRKDSLTADLDFLMQLSQNLNLTKVNSDMGHIKQGDIIPEENNEFEEE